MQSKLVVVQNMNTISYATLEAQVAIVYNTSALKVYKFQNEVGIKK